MKKNTLHSFSRFSEVAQSIQLISDIESKIELCSKYLSDINTDQDLKLATQYLSEGAFSNVSKKKVSIGPLALAKLASEFCEIDYEMVFKPSRNAVGSLAETVHKLFNNLPKPRRKCISKNLSLGDIDEIFIELFNTSDRVKKNNIISITWSNMSPLEASYFIKVMGKSTLDIGIKTKNMLLVLAKAFDQKVKDVQYAHTITGSLGETAILAKNNKLQTARFELFHPLSFLQPINLGAESITDFEELIAEEIFDGIKCQIHVSGSRVEIYSKNFKEITISFPEILSVFKDQNMSDAVIEGVLCVFKNNTIWPISHLQQRMEQKNLSAELLIDFPVIFIGYDILFYRNQPALNKTLTERRSLLEDFCNQFNIPIAVQHEIKTKNDIDELYESALECGNTGLILKKKDSIYDYGSQNRSLLKISPPSETLHVVILYAHSKGGSRENIYSEFTLGVSVEHDDRYEEEFIPIGKAFDGYTNEELLELNSKIKSLTLERFGPTLLLKPEIIVELGFESVQVNKRTKANHTLQLPRFKSIRWDLSLEHVATLVDVERKFEEKLNRTRQDQSIHQSFFIQ